MPDQQPPSTPGRFFIPDLCTLPMVFYLVIIGELLAFILTLSPVNPSADRWTTLSLLSFFIQWIGLSSAGLLCLLRGQLSHLSDTRAGILSYLILLVNTLIFAELAYQGILQFRLLEGPEQLDHTMFLLRTVAIGAIIYAVALRYFYMRHQWRLQVEAESKARLEALQAKIRPHFLFNTMNTIASLIRENPTQAEEAVEDFSDLLRMSLHEQDRFISLAEEITLCEHYLNIEKLRLGTRLNVTWEAGTPDISIRVPPLLLQPLLENAIYHGIEPAPEGGAIHVKIQQQPHALHITIRNPLPDKQILKRAGNRLAIDNIRQRLDLAYQGRARLELTPENAHYRVDLHLPIDGGAP
ncbi:MAG: histidine kinase [Pseudomonadota bacterium]